jgi:AraC family transcriptional regulator, carnitine catabolism transcriptional activator
MMTLGFMKNFLSTPGHCNTVRVPGLSFSAMGLCFIVAFMASRDVAFVLFPRFSMIALFGALEPLRIANRFAGEVFAWRFVSADGMPVAASNDIPVSVTSALRNIGRPDLAMFCASYDHERALAKPVLAEVRKLARRKVMLGAMDTGPFVLAEAGVLDGWRATCHWESLPGFRERYPNVQATRALFENDRGRLTCAGGASSIDMMLDWIAGLHGQSLAVKVADQLVHFRFANESREARVPVERRYRTRDVRLLRAIRAMEESMEEPLASNELADLCGVSQRQMERLFVSEIGTSARSLYLHLRLERAERLLTYGDMSVREAAIACGFSSLSQFSRAFKTQYGKPPSAYRQS